MSLIHCPITQFPCELDHTSECQDECEAVNQRLQAVGVQRVAYVTKDNRFVGDEL